MCDLMEKMENIFYTRAKVDEYIALVRIDECDCNLISSYAVEKLGLKVEDHPSPHEISRYGQMVPVTKQASVSFSIGNYKDTMVCDVAFMDDCHMILGKSWKSSRDVIYNPVRNSYCFVMERKRALIPMSIEQVQQDVNMVKERVRMWLDEKREEEVIGESYVLELDNEYHETKTVQEDVPEKIELLEGPQVNVEEPVVACATDPGLPVIEAANSVDTRLELQSLTIKRWFWNDFIDRIHDEWFGVDGRHLFVKYCAELTSTLWIDSEKLWELLIQRGFIELHEPSVARHLYLTIFQFCRLVFDPGGNSLRFEDESFQEGGNDMIQAREILKRVRLGSRLPA